MRFRRSPIRPAVQKSSLVSPPATSSRRTLDRLDITLLVDGATVRTDSLTLGSGAGTTQFPAEIAFTDLDVGDELILQNERLQ